MKNKHAGNLVILSSLVIMISITILDSTKLIENDIILKAWVSISYTLLVFGILLTKETNSLIKRLLIKSRKKPPGSPGGGTGVEIIPKVIESCGVSIKELLFFVLPVFGAILSKLKYHSHYHAHTSLQNQNLLKEHIMNMRDLEINKLLDNSSDNSRSRDKCK